MQYQYARTAFVILTRAARYSIATPRWLAHGFKRNFFFFNRLSRSTNARGQTKLQIICNCGGTQRETGERGNKRMEIESKSERKRTKEKWGKKKEIVRMRQLFFDANEIIRKLTRAMPSASIVVKIVPLFSQSRFYPSYPLFFFPNCSRCFPFGFHCAYNFAH